MYNFKAHINFHLKAMCHFRGSQQAVSKAFKLI